jgi:hypothetical protein
VFFWNVLWEKPFAALSMLVCLATIYSCISLKRGYVTHIADKFLIGFVGFLAIYQGFHLVHGVGLVTLHVNSTLSDLVDLMVTVLFFQAPMMLRLSCNDRISTGFELRLAKAAPPKTALPLPIRASAEPRDRGVPGLETVAWALPKLSDAAFKLYAYLWLHSDPLTRRVTVDAEDLHRQMGRTVEEVESCLGELQETGACFVHRKHDVPEIEMNAQLTRLSAVLSDKLTSDASTASIEALGA